VGNIEVIAEKLIVGHIATVYGVCGWVKVHSYTEHPKAIFSYRPWFVGDDNSLRIVEVDAWKTHGDGLVAHLRGVDDRDVARDWCNFDIKVACSELPQLTDRDFYWHQLQNLVVYSCSDKGQRRLGLVVSLLETGANDVLVVRGDSESIDRRERLIPYSDSHILKVDLQLQRVEVDWDPDF
jgi:16S rRNA processing protein RimM